MPRPLLQPASLRYFLEVVRCGSASEAAERLHVAASAVSRHVAALEEAVGTALFERHARGMVPTAAGQVLADYARRSTLAEERALDEIHALQQLQAGQVRIAASEAFTPSFLPRLIVEFRARHEGIVFALDAEPPAVVSQRVREGDVDLGLRFARGPEEGIRVEYRRSAPVLALMPPGHPLAGQASLSLRALAAQPLALPGPEALLRQMLDLACSREGLRLRPVLVSNHMGTLQGFVLQGGGVSVSGSIAVGDLRRDGRIAAVPVEDPGLGLRHVEVQTMEGRTLPRAAQAFLELLKERLDAE